MKKTSSSIKDVLENKLNLTSLDYDLYGNFAAKLTEHWLTRNSNHLESSKNSLVLVTGITPTPAGEGKTTVAIALTDALQKSKLTSVCLRQSSLGPFFGVKGGASGGGLANLAFADKTNVHFTGDFHAISSAHNLIAALLDNHLYQGNSLNLDPQHILWKRTLDMNDRSLRQIRIGLGNGNGIERADQFIITAASEVMAALCLSHNSEDLLRRLQKMAIGISRTGEIVSLEHLHATESLRILLEDAIRPNLTLTQGGSPCFIHGGPFANIAHGCNSLRATQAALNLSEIVVTEAGFGSDLGAEKFINIKAPLLKRSPKVAVLVASIRALKFHGGQAKNELHQENLSTLQAGLPNLEHHLHLLQNVYKLPCVVALNVFDSDSELELTFLERHLTGRNIVHARCLGFSKGGEGALALAENVLNVIERMDGPTNYQPLYQRNDSFLLKLEKLAKQVHGAEGINLSDAARADLNRFAPFIEGLPLCLAKTPFSFTADPKRGGLPQSHLLPIERISPSLGAGFVVVTTGEIMLMPGLPKHPRGSEL